MSIKQKIMLVYIISNKLPCYYYVINCECAKYDDLINVSLHNAYKIFSNIK